MKKVLLYNQRPYPALVYEKMMSSGMHIDQTGSISEVLGKYLFGECSHDPCSSYDVFLASINEPVVEVIHFLTYVRKNKPELPLIVLFESSQKTLLKSLLKDVACKFLESTDLDSILKQATLSVMLTAENKY